MLASYVHGHLSAVGPACSIRCRHAFRCELLVGLLHAPSAVRGGSCLPTAGPLLDAKTENPHQKKRELNTPTLHAPTLHPQTLGAGCAYFKKKSRPLRPQTTLTIAKVHNPCHTQCGLLLKRYWLSLSSWHISRAVCECSVGWHISRAVCELSAAYIQQIQTYMQQHTRTCNTYTYSR